MHHVTTFLQGKTVNVKVGNQRYREMCLDSVNTVKVWQLLNTPEPHTAQMIHSSADSDLNGPSRHSSLDQCAPWLL